MKIRTGRTLRRWIKQISGRKEDGSVRQSNTAGLRSQLTGAQRAALYRLSELPEYQALLDVIEMACVEQDTRLINTDAANPEAVLTEHRMSKAFWQIFVAIQKKVEYEREEFLGLQQKASAAEETSEDEDESGIIGL
jgi:hypothetical protein